MSIEKVFILGSGLMGGGIGQVCAQSGLSVTLCDASQKALDKAVKNISWSAGKLIEKGKEAPGLGRNKAPPGKQSKSVFSEGNWAGCVA